MKIPILLHTLLVQLLLHTTTAAHTRALFLFKDVLKSNTTALQTSGFNTLLIFGIGILANGDIKYYSNTPGTTDIVVASSGSYVGGPALAEKVRSFKSAPGTSVQRVEISMNSQNVKSLMQSPGPGTDTVLARNFAALKEAWGLDAVNNDDESIYDVGSTVAFAKMLGQVGYKYSFAPYTNSQFWTRLIAGVDTGGSGVPQDGRLIDRVYLQCYDGGARNDPIFWQRNLGLKVVPLIWVTNDSKPVYGTTAAQARTRFLGWKRSGELGGGGYWNDYDIEKMGLSYAEYAGVLKEVFP
jgi:hypothetical protein